MLDSFLFSLNAIAPIFVLVVLGAVLKKINFVSDSFFQGCDKAVFKICLPCLLFQDIATTNLEEYLDLKFIFFNAAAVVALVILLCSLVPIFVKANDKRGAFIQGVYRSNSAILGFALAESLFPDGGTTTIAMALPFTVVLYNVFAVVILSIFAPNENKLSPKELFVRILKTVVTNPHVISITLALLWQLTPLELPKLVNTSLTYLADMSMPLALLSLGAGFSLASLKAGRLGYAIGASVGKTVIVPIIVVLTGIFMGFRGVELGVIFIIFGGPTAVSSYIMAKQMKSDHELAGQILLISTLMSVLTLFAGIIILREFGLI